MASDVQALVDLLSYVAGGLVAIIFALVGIIYTTHAQDIAKLKKWREEKADPAIAQIDFIDERLTRLEDRV